ncbi:MAG: hypothetical protein K0Q73_6016 [Paenibacillus sp.]|nr:hypothetical protein [Paenibacillus sp.]
MSGIEVDVVCKGGETIHPLLYVISSYLSYEQLDTVS